MKRLSSRYCVFFVMGLSLTGTGCDSSNVVPVSGTLTYKGKPVTTAIINFVPAEGRPSVGETDANGRFTMTYDPQTKGAQKGKHRVFVMRNAAAEASQPGSIPGMPVTLSGEMKEFFEKYNGTNSKMEITIDKANRDLKLDWN